MYLIENLNLSSFYGKTAVYQAYTLILLSVGFLEARFINQRMIERLQFDSYFLIHDSLIVMLLHLLLWLQYLLQGFEEQTRSERR